MRLKNKVQIVLCESEDKTELEALLTGVLNLFSGDLPVVEKCESRFQLVWKVATTNDIEKILGRFDDMMAGRACGLREQFEKMVKAVAPPASGGVYEKPERYR